MKLYKCTLNFLSYFSPGKDVTYPRWDSDDRLLLDDKTYLEYLDFVLYSTPSQTKVEATEKEIKLYYTLKKLRNL